MKYRPRKTRAISRTATAIIAALIVVGILIGVIFASYNGLDRNSHSGTSSSSSTSQRSSTSSSSSTTATTVSLSLENNPDYLAYDPSNGDIYVAYWNSTSISVFSGATYQIIANIPVSSVSTIPGGMLFDPNNGEIYVTMQSFWNPQSFGWVYAINTTSNKVEATINIYHDPSGLALDSQNGCIYIANYDSSTVSVINTTTNQIFATLDVGAYPVGVAFDSSNGLVYVTNTNYPSNSGTISVINGSTNYTIQTLTLPDEPSSIVYDSSNNYLYVAMQNPLNSSVHPSVEVINAGTNNEVANIQNNLADPTAMIFESYNGYVYVTNAEASGYVTVIDQSAAVATVTVGASPIGMAFDSSRKDLYVANSDSNTISVIDTASNTVVATIS